jgi:hypothetical protein
MTYKFEQSRTGGFIVYLDGRFVGKVKKNENWTVRGTRIDWSAYIAGRYIGTADTRKGAVALLTAS